MIGEFKDVFVNDGLPVQTKSLNLEVGHYYLQMLRELLFKLNRNDFLEMISKSKVYSMMLNTCVDCRSPDRRQK